MQVSQLVLISTARLARLASIASITNPSIKQENRFVPSSTYCVPKMTIKFLNLPKQCLFSSCLLQSIMHSKLCMQASKARMVVPLCLPHALPVCMHNLLCIKLYKEHRIKRRCFGELKILLAIFGTTIDTSAHTKISTGTTYKGT
jgi:hypothetical protein